VARDAHPVLFGDFFNLKKSDSKSGRVHAGVGAVEQARTFAGLSAAMLQELESWVYCTQW
jgi:hypothetical protein